jgi:hypothetical protein
MKRDRLKSVSLIRGEPGGGRVGVEDKSGLVVRRMSKV